VARALHPSPAGKGVIQRRRPLDPTRIALRYGATLLAYGHRLDAVGVDRVPDRGPVVLAARHYHHFLDGVGLIKQVRRPVHFLVALDWVSKRSTRAVMEALTSLAEWPVTLRAEELGSETGGDARTGRRAFRQNEVLAYQRRAYRQCLALLCDERVLVAFPEGYPVVDPHARREPRSMLLAPFKSGFARLAVAASRTMSRPIPVVPVGIRVEEPPTGRLVFTYGHGRPVTASTDVDALTRDIYDDVLRLSA